MTRRLAALAGAGASVLALAACGDSGGSSVSRADLDAYVARVEPIRLGTNRLLDRADPILSAYAEGRIGPGQAQRRIDALERRFADYAVRIDRLSPVPAGLRDVQDEYAHTYVFEDAYLSALAAAIPERAFDKLPDTQDQQRAAITGWRIKLESLAAENGARLPADLQAAGRGEIAPAPSGS